MARAEDLAGGSGDQQLCGALARSSAICSRALVKATDKQARRAVHGRRQPFRRAAQSDARKSCRRAPLSHEGLSQARCAFLDVAGGRRSTWSDAARTRSDCRSSSRQPAPSSAATPAKRSRGCAASCDCGAPLEVPPRMGVRDARQLVEHRRGRASLSSPRKPRSAFFIWMDSVGRDAMKEANPSVSGVGELGKLCGDKWLSMGESERAEWERRRRRSTHRGTAR